MEMRLRHDVGGVGLSGDFGEEDGSLGGVASGDTSESDEVSGSAYTMMSGVSLRPATVKMGRDRGLDDGAL